MIAILVPVLGRPQNVAPFMESLAKATRSEYQVYFLCSKGDEDQIAACRETDAQVMVMPFHARRADFAKKINRAFDATEEEWLFQGADDIRFGPDWDVNAMVVAKRKHARVVGTNDLGNPLVLRGKHSTHTLFARSYIDDRGGTADDTGRVFSEAYDHQYCDSEFIQLAMLRREWAFARNSIVEHLHPHWRKGERDATYEKAFRSTKEDMELYRQRMRAVTERHRSRRLHIQ